jgi:hypothetical protein
VNPIAKMLIDMAKFYDQNLEERQLEMYVEVLSKFPLADVMEAGRQYVFDTKNFRFPMPVHKIMEKFLPQSPDHKDVGRELALRIRHAISLYGWPGPIAARTHIGEDGWVIVDKLGGWQHLCENLGATIQETTFMAQVRDAVETTSRLSQQGFNPARPAIEQGCGLQGKEIKYVVHDELKKSDFMKLIPDKDKK